MRNFINIRTTFTLTAILLLLSGCMGFHHQRANKTSLVEFLYPQREGYVATTEIPQLNLPLRVGIAYTPSAIVSSGGFTELEKTRLAEDVVSEFDALEFVDTITVIPSDYLRPGGGFTNLDQVKQLFGVDVIVLLSYDQTIVTSNDLAALTYWTIIGAYVIPGEKNDTQTLIDAAVYDISSRKLLFRAPGSSVVKSRDTWISNSETLRENSVEGFQIAGATMARNLSTELEKFKANVKASPTQYQVSMRPGYSGSGSSEGMFLLIMCVLLATVFVQGCKSRRDP